MNNRYSFERNNVIHLLSNDHHYGLAFCSHIGAGLRANIDVKRIKNYIDWFFNGYLSAHFEMEEKCIFPVLTRQHDLVKKALADHRKLTRLFTVPTQLERTLGLIEEKLENHIRFEERILFKEIKAIVSATVSEEIVVLHSQKPDTSFFKSWQDAFWI